MSVTQFHLTKLVVWYGRNSYKYVCQTMWYSIAQRFEPEGLVQGLADGRLRHRLFTVLNLVLEAADEASTARGRSRCHSLP